MTFEEKNYMFDLERRIFDLEINMSKGIGAAKETIKGEVIDDFFKLRNDVKSGDVICPATWEELDRLTVELLKVVELKKIASILAEKE